MKIQTAMLAFLLLAFAASLLGEAGAEAEAEASRRSRKSRLGSEWGEEDGGGGGIEEDEEEEEETEEAQTREKKLLNLFTVVRFRNGPCTGSDGLNGTCYTAVECSQRGGSSAGSCAAGYGVCCTFTIGCGATSSENCTYFASSGTQTAGSCCATICPCGDNICQLRLDFNSFVITGPSTSTVVVGQALNGILTPAAGTPVTQNTQCLTDTFTVTAPGNNVPPTICGSNTGDHMYLDSTTNCNMLCFQLGNTATGVAATATRQWNIKVTQYSCDYDNLAPDGCTQYFFGATSQTVQTFNFDGGSQLADQNQNICVRRERNNCRICWSPQQTADFSVNGATTKNGLTADSLCCAYANNGIGTSGFDCVIVPGASKNTANSDMLPGDEFCGRNGFATINNNNAAQGTVCSRTQPFNLRFLSDFYDTAAEVNGNNLDVGFRLTYIQTAC